MKYYHGTEKKFDPQIIGPPPKVDVDKGGGEIGKGFYTTNDPWIAKSWAIARYGDDASIIEVELTDISFSMLSFLIKTQEELLAIWHQLKTNGTTRTYTFGVDIVNAPFATIESARQYKFESKRAENDINKSSIKKVY